MNELALFAGAGGGILGAHLLGWRTIAAVEIDPYCREVLLRRQRDGVLPLFPIWDDIRTFDGRPLRGRVDVVSGGFPCQDISQAGSRAGITGERSGLWQHMLRVVREVRPRFVFVENSAELVSRGLGAVLGDLASSGFDTVRWSCIPAAYVGAPQGRDRIWIAADMHGHGCARVEEWDIAEQNAERRDDPHGLGVAQHRASSAKAVFLGMDDAPAARLDRLTAINNAQVPLVAATAWSRLMRRVEEDQ